MSVDETEVRKIAHLARLDIANHDVPQYSENLSKILSLIEQMNEIDTEGIVPMAHPLDTVQRLRTDQVTELHEPDEFLELAPQAQSGLYLVPKVID